jgi:hypothetical protein
MDKAIADAIHSKEQATGISFNDFLVSFLSREVEPTSLVNEQSPIYQQNKGE